MQHAIDSHQAGPRRMGPIVGAVSILCAGALAVGADERVLVEDGKARYVMVLPERPVMLHCQKHGAVAHFFCGFNPRLQRRQWPAGQRIVTALLYPFLWMQSKILWDPARSPEPEALLRQYCEHVYGPAADPMVAYYELLIRRWESTWASASGLTKADFMYGVKFPPSVSDRLKALLAEAESLTEPKTRPYQMVRYVARGMAPSFFKELDTYAKADPQKTPRYFCTVTDRPPVVDGRLDEPAWANQLHFELRRRAWGEPSDRATRIRLLRDETSLYVAAELDLPEGSTGFDAEAQSATPFSAYLSRNYYTSEQMATVLCQIGLSAEGLKGMTLRARTGDGQALASAGELTPDAALKIPLANLPVGEHGIALELRRADGRAAAGSDAAEAYTQARL